MSDTAIPTRSRDLVRARQGGACFRCQAPANQWHHRRTRAVNRPHRHCPCNGVLLCPTCHSWAHRYPVQAKAVGLIVATTEDNPHTIPMHGLWGWSVLSCDGAGARLSLAQVVMAHGAPTVAG